MSDIPFPTNPLHALFAHPQIGPMLMQLLQHHMMQGPFQVAANGGGMYGGLPRGAAMDSDGSDAKPYPPRPTPNPARDPNQRESGRKAIDQNYPACSQGPYPGYVPSQMPPKDPRLQKQDF
jgi:hypothetical protein